MCPTSRDLIGVCARHRPGRGRRDDAIASSGLPQDPSSKWSIALMTAFSSAMRLPTLRASREVRTTPIACVARNQVWPAISKVG